ncbi:MAG: DUF6529 family protein [Actinomycetota bacterium]|nr:DUF6529 family protein [Actinomycetota bacterium]
MEDFFVNVTGDRVPEVKLVLTLVVVVLATYQVLMMAVGYGKLKLPFLSSGAASFSHRSVGDAIVPVTLFIAIACLSYFGLEDWFDEAFLHGVLGVLLAVVLAFKIAVVRRLHSLSRFLPVLGVTVFILFALTAFTVIGGD